MPTCVARWIPLLIVLISRHPSFPFQISDREDELNRRERELERREQQLEYRERKVGDLQAELGLVADRTPNWPKCRPIIYHNIKEDIPEDGQLLVKRVYFGWICTIFYCGRGSWAHLAPVQ